MIQLQFRHCLLIYLVTDLIVAGCVKVAAINAAKEAKEAKAEAWWPRS